MSRSLLDPGQIIQSVYDDTTGKIRVDAQVSVTQTGAQEVVISQADDTIAIGDGSKLFTGTDVSGKHAIDANIVGGVVSGNFTSSGLSTGLKQTVITVTDVAQKIPASALANRNGISVRIWGSNTVYFGNSSVTATDGYPKRQYEEIVLDIKDNSAVDLYAVCSAGQSSELRILEIA